MPQYDPDLSRLTRRELTVLLAGYNAKATLARQRLRELDEHAASAREAGGSVDPAFWIDYGDAAWNIRWLERQRARVREQIQKVDAERVGM